MKRSTCSSRRDRGLVDRGWICGITRVRSSSRTDTVATERPAGALVRHAGQIWTAVLVTPPGEPGHRRSGLPYGELAIVSDAKVVDYLLSPEHPQGRGKAASF